MIAAGLWQPLVVTASSGAPDELGPRVFFWIIAVLTVAGAVSTVTRRNAIAAVMSLVATFFGVAALYALLSAHFLAVLQVLVYAGAIMTLFVFVVMVLNRDESEPWALSAGVIAKLVGVFALVYLVTRLGYHLFDYVPPPSRGATPGEFGTVAQVGTILFSDNLFVFEAVSLLLLIAVIAAVVVARARSVPDQPGASSDEDHASPAHSGDHA